MQFAVPQFTDVEDKIFGPFTFKQFIFLGGGAGLSYFVFALLPKSIALIGVLPVAGFSLALAFYRVNDQPFLSVLEHAFYYSIRGKLFLWKHRAPKVTTDQQNDGREIKNANELPSLSDSKLRQISWSLDINEYVDEAGKGIKKQQR